MTTDYKVTELFCIIDEFCKHFGFFVNLGDKKTMLISFLNTFLPTY